jgi:L-alanine-DL-glutamate epimerase-like enolase superfamily enzyme
VDVGLWDLKARLLDLPLVTLLGQQRDDVAIYGGGGFTTYSSERLAE